MITTNAPHRYHPALVTLHWFLALLILAEAAIGVSPHFVPGWAPRHTQLQIHMILGILILAAVLVRVVVRIITPKPPAATTGNAFFDFIGKVTHAMLYVLVIALTASAALSAYHAGLLRLAIGQAPRNLGYFAGRLHVLLFLALGLAVGLHVAAALFHQFILRDRLFARMGYGRAAHDRSADPQPEQIADDAGRPLAAAPRELSSQQPRSL